jgi:PAS domain S-box-containing protein
MSAANVAIGMLLVLPAFHAPWIAFAALVPAAFLHGAYRLHGERIREDQQLQELYGAASMLSRELSIDVAARRLARHARDLVDADRAEVKLLDNDSTFWAARSGSEVQSGSFVASERYDHDLVTGSVQYVVKLAGAHGAVGEICVQFGSGSTGAASVSQRDRRVLEMFAQHASTSLDNAILFARANRQRRTFAQVFDHSSEGLLVLDQSGAVLAWNPAMARISGVPARDMVGAPVSLLSLELGTVVGNAHKPGVLDATITTAHGERRSIRASYSPTLEDMLEGSKSDELRWVIVVRDITREQETERLKDDFVATVSHELRTPLTTIKGFIETMCRNDIVIEPDQAGAYLEIMGREAERLERLVNDLLDMSALESGRALSVGVAPVDIVEVTRDAVSSHMRSHPGCDIELAGADRPIVVAADADRLLQVLRNLLDNAWKHGEGTPTTIAIDLSDEGLASVAVTDNGPGIHAGDLAFIFERFYVTAESVTRTGGGAGLGLYICHCLVDAMGGTIDARSELGAGSTFRVTLPAIGEVRQSFVSATGAA